MSRDIAAAGSGYQFLPARGSEMDTPTRIMRFICANASANGMGRSTMEVMASMPTSWTAAAPRYLGRHLAVGVWKSIEPSAVMTRSTSAILASKSVE